MMSSEKRLYRKEMCWFEMTHMRKIKRKISDAHDWVKMGKNEKQ